MANWLLDQLRDALTAILYVFFATLAGALSFLAQVQEGKKFLWGEFFLHCSISAMAGYITFQLMVYTGLPESVSGALCGIAGWMGTRLMKILEYVFLRRLGVDATQAQKEQNNKS